MEYIVGPIAALLKWTFDEILVPIGELPELVNPNNIFISFVIFGLGYWLFLQKKYNNQAAKDPNQLQLVSLFQYLFGGIFLRIEFYRLSHMIWSMPIEDRSRKRCKRSRDLPKS